MTNMLPGRAWAQSSDHETAPSAIKPFAPTNVTSVPHNGSRTSSRLRMAERSDANVFVLPPASNVSETASEAQNLPLQLNIQKYPELHAPHKKLLRGVRLAAMEEEKRFPVGQQNHDFREASLDHNR